MTNPKPRVLVILARGAEEMEVVIVVDVLRRAGVEVALAGLDGKEPVRCSRGVVLVPELALADAAGPFAAIVLPGGGEGSERLAKSQLVGSLLAAQERDGRCVAAICAAPAALALHGVGRGRAMTVYPGLESKLAGHARSEDRAVCEDRPILTGRGQGAAFEFALALVKRLCGAATEASVRAPLVLA